MKATAIAPSNIALTKYWGKKDEELRLPENGSISMCLSNLLTTTTVEFSSKYEKDSVKINGEVEEGEESRVIEHLDRIRQLAKISLRAKVVSNNNFPSGTGLSSSASGFAALTLACAKAAGLNLSEKELSILARQGSGSACRSIPDGFVEWLDGKTSETSFAKTIFPESHWNIVDVVAIVSEQRKDIGSTKGMSEARSSLFMPVRVQSMRAKNKLLKKLIKERNFKEFGELIEAEALEFHSVVFTQIPPIIYWTPNTVKLMKLVQIWRKAGLDVYFTINTGQDIHLIIEQKNIDKLTKLLKQVPEIKEIIINYPGQGTRLTTKHLF
ncbi:diphosphomevalonate decarboxylase [Candidatus Daviesbacteria bacterium]|nr:diphosphomevalonate decarboxylase [Candidatus Daviesbacteria bacterium]